MANQSKPQTSKGSQSNTGLDPLLMMVLAIMTYVIVVMLWSRFHTPLSTAYAYWRYFTNGLGWLFGQHVANIPLLVKPFHDAVEYFRLVPYSEVQFSTITDTSKPVNIGLWLFVLLPLAIRSIRTSLKTNPLNHRNFGKPRDFNLKTFMKAQEKVYPHLELFSALNMLKQGVNEGPFRMPDNGKQFLLRNGLVDAKSTQEVIVPDLDKAALVFRNQLGDFWKSVEELKPHELVLFAAFAPKAAGNYVKMTDGEYVAALKESSDMLASLWDVFSPDAKGTVASPKALRAALAQSKQYEKAKVIAKKYQDSPVVTAVIKRHAYVKTVLYELLEQARRTGVLPGADFRWLIMVDRPLCLTLENVGRSVASCEVAGIYAHYLYEMKAGVAIDRPQVATAVEALGGAFPSLMFSDDEWLQVKADRAKALAEAQSEPTPASAAA